MVEVKADALEQSFDAFQDEDDGVAALKAELETLKARIASGESAAKRSSSVRSSPMARMVVAASRSGVMAGTILPLCTP